MSRLRVSIREIGSVRVFDLQGDPTQETVQEIAWKIQRNIRRYRLQRIILNLQMIPSLDPLGLRKLVAACLRPRKSLIYGVNNRIANSLEEDYLPRNVRVCASEREVAEGLGPFLLEKGKDNEFPALESAKAGKDSIGSKLERRRSKRMHVAIPLELQIHIPNTESLSSKAIATNIADGGLFVEYLDLEVAQKIEALEPLKGLKVSIQIFPSANFPEEYHLDGKIIRSELRKKQLGLAVEFLSE